MFWILVVATGLIGAVADIVLSNWSRTNEFVWFLAGAVGFVVFMTGLGLIIRRGAINGHPLAIALTLTVLFNIAFVAVWEVHGGTQLSALQWVGVALAVMAVTCFELGHG